MIAGVQVRNVQKSRSGLTRMAKLTFEDLTGSIPAMLWPEEFAKIERPGQERPDRLRQGDARPPPRPGRADHQPRSSRSSEAPPSCPRAWSSACTRGSTRTSDLERLLRLRPRPARATSTSTSRSSASSSVRRAIYKAGSSLQDPLRRPADRRPRSAPSAPATSACSAARGAPPGSSRPPQPAARRRRPRLRTLRGRTGRRRLENRTTIDRLSSFRRHRDACFIEITHSRPSHDTFSRATAGRCSLSSSVPSRDRRASGPVPNR